MLKGLPDDKGLFMPEYFPSFSNSFLKEAPSMSFSEVAMHTAETLLTDSMDRNTLWKIVDESMNFDFPLVNITDSIYALELFHGPTLAFKDVGARFMAGLMAAFMKHENKRLTILVATSGDTGGAVANGFHKKEGIEVIILYPSGKVSGLQEKQLITPGENITAIKVEGTFDDCQRLVKEAFTDPALTGRYNLSSANSINIARLIPQSFYYIYAATRLAGNGLPVVFCVPSGNFGNLTAGLFAWRMGLPVSHFIAATNVNDTVPSYLQTGKYIPRKSEHTLSNAMDVGDPSNFYRLLEIFGDDIDKMRNLISGERVSDEATRQTIEQIRKSSGYLLDPHGAVGYTALEKYVQVNRPVNGIFLETAHPAKFADVMEEITGSPVVLPPALAALKNRAGYAIPLSNRYEDFRDFLLTRTS